MIYQRGDCGGNPGDQGCFGSYRFLRGLSVTGKELGVTCTPSISETSSPTSTPSVTPSNTGTASMTPTPSNSPTPSNTPSLTLPAQAADCVAVTTPYSYFGSSSTGMPIGCGWCWPIAGYTHTAANPYRITAIAVSLSGGACQGTAYVRTGAQVASTLLATCTRTSAAFPWTNFDCGSSGFIVYSGVRYYIHVDGDGGSG
jgi:hypothetical protein